MYKILIALGLTLSLGVVSTPSMADSDEFNKSLETIAGFFVADDLCETDFGPFLDKMYKEVEQDYGLNFDELQPAVVKIYDEKYKEVTSNVITKAHFCAATEDFYGLLMIREHVLGK